MVRGLDGLGSGRWGFRVKASGFQASVVKVSRFFWR